MIISLLLCVAILFVISFALPLRIPLPPHLNGRERPPGGRMYPPNHHFLAPAPAPPLFFRAKLADAATGRPSACSDGAKATIQYTAPNADAAPRAAAELAAQIGGKRGCEPRGVYILVLYRTGEAVSDHIAVSADPSPSAASGARNWGARGQLPLVATGDRTPALACCRKS